MPKTARLPGAQTMRNYALAAALLVAFCVCGAPARATTYFVDSAGGSDSFGGTSPSTAWATLAKVNASSFSPGDSVLFNSGQVWRGLLTVTSSGSTGSPITFGAYGTGAAPIISAAVQINPASWTLYGGNVYVANLVGAGTLNQLYVDGAFVEPARVPATGFFLTTSPSPDLSTVVDTNLPAEIGANSLVGATIVLKTSVYAPRQEPISAYDGVSKLTVSTPFPQAGYPFQSVAGYGYYLRGQLWMLQAPRQFYYDSAAGKLYLWTADGSSPASHTVEYANQPYAINLSGANYVSVLGLIAEFAKFNDIYSTGSTNLTINAATLGGYSGIQMVCASCSVTGGTYNNALRYGVNITGDNTTVDSATVLNAGSVLISPDSYQPAAITLIGSNTSTTNDTITNSGYSGVLNQGAAGSATSGQNVTVSNNVVTSSCTLLSDCGAIYTPLTEADQTLASCFIYGNTINHVIGNNSGSPVTFTAGYAVYLDEGQHGCTVQKNTMSDEDVGVFMNLGNSNTITSNLIHMARRQAILANETSPGTVFGNIITYNVLEALGTPFEYIDTTADVGNIGYSDYNLFCHPNNTYVAEVVRSSTNVDYTLATWRSTFSQDPHSSEFSSLCPRVTVPAVCPAPSP